ncbi:MAG TPA: DUF362 domain-containing protein [Spirochaetes bacterium]|nr:DUF362 domain-containing protein [Spirochaetota bacterium]
MKKKYALGSGDNRVLIRRCEDYDQQAIEEIVRGGMKELGYAPSGKVFVKPNVVFATKNGRYGSTSYTHPLLVGGALRALAGSAGVDRVDMGEKTAIGYPTRMTMKYAGYYETVREAGKASPVPVSLFCIEEEKRERVFIGGNVHDTLRVPRAMARADTAVYLPKLKCHCVSGMTGAVKLNIGICSDDERAIRHDFMLNEKIVDLLGTGYPDFTVMDAIDVGVGNEAVPTPRRLGLIIMSRNPLAADLVGARLLGMDIGEVPYLVRAVECGYGPGRLSGVKLLGDITTLKALDRHAERIKPYDDEFYHWQDVEREFKNLRTPMRFYWGGSRARDGSRCLTGCVMGLKMFMGFHERFAGSEAFRKAKPVVFVIGNVDERIDARGEEVFMLGSCARADVVNAKRVTKINNCFTTAVEMTMAIRGRMGIPSPFYDIGQVLPLALYFMAASGRKLITGRYFQDITHFFAHGLLKKL